MTAEMIVGDAGGAGAADYTVLGDAVNTGSRLEAANKYLGTRTPINERARDMLDGDFLLRPVGKIEVVGKDEAVMCYEPLARSADASEAQRDLVARTTRIVEAFIAHKFDEVARYADEMDSRHGPSKLAALYRSASLQRGASPPPAEFDGRIVLTEK